VRATEEGGRERRDLQLQPGINLRNMKSAAETKGGGGTKSARTVRAPGDGLRRRGMNVLKAQRRGLRREAGISGENKNFEA